MSSATAAHQQLIGKYLATSASALYLFESCLTFTQEVEVIWLRKWTAMTWLYVFTRYNAVLIAIFGLIPGWNHESCKVTVYIAGVLGLLQFVHSAVFPALRIYALLDGRLLLAGVTLALGLVPFAVNIYTFTNFELLWYPDIKICTLLLKGASFPLSLSTRIAVIAADALALGVTWFKTVQLYGTSRRLQLNTPLVTLLLRDGTLYFLVILGINTFVPIANTIPIFVKLNISTFALKALPEIITCRFILNLRQIQPSVGSETYGSTSTVSIRFVGNMGQALQVSDDKEVDNAVNGRRSRSELDSSVTVIGDVREDGLRGAS